MNEMRRALTARYRPAGLPARLHTQIRLRLCPLEQIAGQLPLSGRILDYGCGLGLLSNLLELQSPQRRIAGVDIDERKIAAARLTQPDGRIRFSAIAPGEFPAGPWDAVVMSDVLYLVPFDRQEELVRAAYTSLVPGGTLVVKEIAARPRWKYLVNFCEETLAVKLLHITRGGRFYFRDERGNAGMLSSAGFRVTVLPVDRGYPHPHIVYSCRKVLL